MSTAESVVAGSVFRPVIRLYRRSVPEDFAVAVHRLEYLPLKVIEGAFGSHLVLRDGRTLGVYKWGRGKGAQREVAAFELSDETGLGVVPRTRKWSGRYGKGILQEYVPATAGVTAVRKGERTQRMAAFDYAVAQGDRAEADENFLVLGDGRPMSHDNGTTFNEPAPGKVQFIQSNFVVAHLNEPLAPGLVDELRSADLGRVADRMHAAELDTPAIDGAVARLTEMREEGRITGRAWDGLIVDSRFAVRYPTEAPSIEEWVRAARGR
ncbi:hypothetical protein [Actinoallomurus iriomotensis]|uniref:hypothetical protein n=1 Tax=Actinoallomurus iriomotensis TaxID=478107 RepID=UPI0025578BBE|nr:hypothetical protein [Actinoallomurus iriomotensis]